MADKMGYESHAECHGDLKRAFYDMPPGKMPPSMADMDLEEATRFISWVQRRASEVFGLYLPDPYEMGVSDADVDQILQQRRES